MSAHRERSLSNSALGWLSGLFSPSLGKQDTPSPSLDADQLSPSLSSSSAALPSHDLDGSASPVSSSTTRTRGDLFEELSSASLASLDSQPRAIDSSFPHANLVLPDHSTGGGGGDDDDDDDEEEEEQGSPSQSFEDWIAGFVVVDFDLEYGQRISTIVPSSAPTTATSSSLSHSASIIVLEADEQSDVAFLSFPDNTGCGGHGQTSVNDTDTVYVYRLRRSAAALRRQLPADENGFLYGFVFFRQQRNDSLPRGYLQRSVVLLTHRCFLSLYMKVIDNVGRLYFTHGDDLLAAALAAVSLWPVPMPGALLSLPILGLILDFTVPYGVRSRYVQSSPPPSSSLQYRSIAMTNFESLYLYDQLGHQLKKLWLLWELVLLGEPILVVSPTPAECSLVVLCLVSLVAPLSYSGDYRPYFTVHDSDFAVYTADSGPAARLPPVLLGVTNPFFIKALSHWPHVLVTANSPDGSIKRSFKSKHKLLCVAERSTLLNALRSPLSLSPSSSSKSDSVDRNEVVRRYFIRLTERFLHPLKKYFAKLMPVAKTIHPFAAPPRVRNFNQTEFLESLTLTKQSVTNSRSNEERLYGRFFSSPNFTDWLRASTEAADEKLAAMYRLTLYEPLHQSQLRGRTEVELADLYLRLIVEEQRVVFGAEPLAAPIRLADNVALLHAALPDRVQHRLHAIADRAKQISFLKACLPSPAQTTKSTPELKFPNEDKPPLSPSPSVGDLNSNTVI